MPGEGALTLGVNPATRETPAHSSEMCCDASKGKLRELPGFYTSVAHLARHTEEGAEGREKSEGTEFQEAGEERQSSEQHGSLKCFSIYKAQKGCGG